MRVATVLVAALALSGCGSIVRGTGEDVVLNVSPSTADVRLSNGMTCTGSCVLNIPRKETFTVTASAPGYQSKTVAVGKKIEGGGAAGFAGNILVGGVIGMGVDAATGAAFDHYPNPVDLNLKPIGRGTGGAQSDGSVPTS